MLLLTLGYRTNLTGRQLAALFAVSQSQVDRVTHDLAPHLAALLGPPPADRRELWIVDGSMIPVHDHTRSAKSRNYRRSVNVQVIARARDRRVVAVGTAWPANRHDVIVFRETSPKIRRCSRTPDCPAMAATAAHPKFAARSAAPAAGSCGTGPTNGSPNAAQ